MAGNPQNQEIGIRGEDIILDVWFRSYSGGPLVDPDSTPTFSIYDPSNTLKTSGSGTRVSTGYYTATYTIPSDATLSTLWKITWSALINGVAVSGNEEYFEVKATGSIDFSSTETAAISDYWLNHVKKALAYPSVDNIILTDAEIKAYCVYPALREYFTKFPIRSTTEHTLSTSADVDIDFPDSNTFGVIDARVVGKQSTSGQGNSFWDLVYYNQMGMTTMRGQSYGIPRYNPGGRKQSIMTLRQAAASQENEATVHIRVEEENSKVVAYTNSYGKLNVTWAKMSSDFTDVRFVYKMDVIKLSQSYLKEHLADTTGLINTDLAISVDSDTLRSEAKELRDQVMEKWNAIPSIVVIRST